MKKPAKWRASKKLGSPRISISAFATQHAHTQQSTNQHVRGFGNRAERKRNRAEGKVLNVCILRLIRAIPTSTKPHIVNRGICRVSVLSQRNKITVSTLVIRPSRFPRSPCRVQLNSQGIKGSGSTCWIVGAIKTGSTSDFWPSISSNLRTPRVAWIWDSPDKPPRRGIRHFIKDRCCISATRKSKGYPTPSDIIDVNIQRKRIHFPRNWLEWKPRIAQNASTRGIRGITALLSGSCYPNVFCIPRSRPHARTRAMKSSGSIKIILVDRTRRQDTGTGSPQSKTTKSRRGGIHDWRMIEICQQ